MANPFVSLVIFVVYGADRWSLAFDDDIDAERIEDINDIGFMTPRERRRAG